MVVVGSPPVKRRKPVMCPEPRLVPLSIAAETPAFPRAETSLAQKHIEPFPLKRFHSRVSAHGKKLRYNIGVSARKCKTRAIFCKHQLK